MRGRHALKIRAWNRAVAGGVAEADCLDESIEGATAGASVRKLDGIFDNRESRQREYWIKGHLAGQWPSHACLTGLTTMTPWERKILEQPWGHYPNAPYVEGAGERGKD